MMGCYNGKETSHKYFDEKIFVSNTIHTYEILLGAIEFNGPLKFCDFLMCALELRASFKIVCDFVICATKFKEPLKFLIDLVIWDLDICDRVYIGQKGNIFVLVMFDSLENILDTCLNTIQPHNSYIIFYDC